MFANPVLGSHKSLQATFKKKAIFMRNENMVTETL